MTPEGIPAYPPGMGDPNYDGSGGGTYGGSGGNKKTSTNTGDDRREQYITDYVTTSKVKGGGEKIGPPGDKDIEYDDRDFKKPENKKIRDRQRDKYQRQWTSKGIAPPGPNRKKRQRALNYLNKNLLVNYDRFGSYYDPSKFGVTKTGYPNLGFPNIWQGIEEALDAGYTLDQILEHGNMIPVGKTGTSFELNPIPDLDIDSLRELASTQTTLQGNSLTGYQANALEDMRKNIQKRDHFLATGDTSDIYPDPPEPKQDDPVDPCAGPNPPAYCFSGIRTPPSTDPTPDPGDGTPAGTVFPYKDYGTPGYETSKTFMDIAYPGGYNFLLARGGRVPAAFGGIMDTRTGRRAYGLGSVFKSITKPFKSVAKAAGKVLKSPIGQAALLYGAGTYLGGMKAFGGAGTGGFFSRLKSPSNLANLFKVKNWSQGNLLNPLLRSYDDKLGEYTGLSPVKGIMNLSTLPFVMEALGIGQPKQQSLGMGDRGGGLIDPLTGQESLPGGMRQTLNDALADAWDEKEQAYDAAKMSTIKQAYPFLGQYPTFQVAKDGGRIGFSEGGWEAEWDEIYEDYKLKQIKLGKEYISKEEFIDMHRDNNAQGGRIGAQEGGLMNLGGMEKDYRNNGGFVAIGGEERADDVPARLSRNEFVFTADAVRGAGGGDIDKGAEIMENVMKNLEQGGKISEETQGNTGAQEMFSVSERIGEVL